MKIRSQVITAIDIVEALPKGCTVAMWTNLHYKRWKFAFNVRVTGSASTTMYKLPFKSATYDEWGELLATLYEKDPDMKANDYKNAADFHEKTKGVFRTDA